MHRARRCAPAGTAWARPAPTEPRPCAAARSPGRPPCRAAACPTRHTIPRAPRPRIRPTARAPALRPPRAAARVPLSRCVGPGALGWQESHRMHPFFAECAKKAPFLATSARNACFSRSRWQHPRPMHPFPGAIGRFGIHGARILPPRALFRVEEPEITHGAKMLPAPPGLSAAAACGPAEWALRHAAAACDTRHGRTGFAPCGVGLACLLHAPPAISLAPAAARVHRRRLTRVALRRLHRVHRAQPSAPPPIAVGVSADWALPAALVLPTPTHRAHRCALAGTAWAPTRANRAPAPSQPDPGPEPTGPRPPVEPPAPIRAPPLAAPHPAARVPLRFR